MIFHDELMAMRSDWKIILSTGAVLVAALLAAAQTLFIKHRLSHLDPVTMAYYQLLLGFWPVLLLSVGLGDPAGFRLGRDSLIALLYLGVFASALAFALFYWLLAQTSAVNLTLFVYITPLVAIVSGWLLLGEVPGPRILVGTAFVLGGIVLTPSSRQPTRAPVRP